MQIVKKVQVIIILFLLLNYNISQSLGADDYKTKTVINGSGLKIPRMVSLKKSLVFMRTGPGKEYPVKFEFKKIKYPFKIIAEYNNWRQVETFNNISGWIHTQLLSSLKTGLILKTTLLYQSPLKLVNPKAKLLPHLLVKIKNCDTEWCKVEIIKNNTYIGWVKKDLIWGATKNNIQ